MIFLIVSIIFLIIAIIYRKQMTAKRILKFFSGLLIILTIWIFYIEISNCAACLINRGKVKIQYITSQFQIYNNHRENRGTDIFIVEAFCNNKESYRGIFDYYSKMPKSDSIKGAAFFERNNLFNEKKYDIYSGEIDWATIAKKHQLVYFKFDTLNTDKLVHVFFHNTKEKIQYESLESGNNRIKFICNNISINRKTLQQIINTISSFKDHLSRYEFTYFIYSSDNTEYQIKIKYEDFGGRFELQIL